MSTKSTSEHKAKRFRLALTNAAEDVPRMIRAYGRACFGEFALVLRPTEGRGVLVLLTKEGGRVWRAIEGDAPVLPEIGIDARDALALVKSAQKGLEKEGPITLRGQWSGHLHCDEGAPRVELTRKLAAYGVLRIVSSPTGWSWTVERTEKWFSTASSDAGTAATLAKAIEAGLSRAMGLLGEACSTRDSHRRAAYDESWASTHPIRPAKEPKDPTERLKLEKPRRTKVPPRMDEPVALPDAPATPAGVQRMADEVAREADALASLRGVRWLWQDSSTLHDAIVWFREAGLLEIADDLASYRPSPDHPPEQLLERLGVELEGVKLGTAMKTGAKATLGAVADAFREAPYVLERARSLVRYAARLVETELCQGRERREAAKAIENALHAYEQARHALEEGQASEARTGVRSTVEWASLAAAKAARACALGQTGLLVPSKPAEPAPVVLPVEAPPKRPRRPSQVPGVESPPAPLPEPSAKPTRARKPKAEPLAPAPTEPAPSRKPRGKEKPLPEVQTPPTRAKRKPKAPPEPKPPEIETAPAPRKRAKKAAPAPEIDAEKDKLLLDAFRDAVSTAMRETESA